jgi:hypothetical protein
LNAFCLLDRDAALRDASRSELAERRALRPH